MTYARQVMSAVSDHSTLGKRVRSIREAKGIRQVDLAASAALSWRHLIRIEQDRGGITKPATVSRIASALGVSREEIAGADDDEEAAQVVSLDEFLRLRVLQIMREATA